MSYDIALTIDTGGPDPAVVWDGWNYTSNCAPMWCDAGADLATFEGALAGDCLPELGTAIATMEDDPARFRALNPSNGWGSYDSLLPRLRVLQDAFAAHPKATVVVDR